MRENSLDKCNKAESKNENSETIGRFTNWLKTMILRSKIDYIRRQKKHYTQMVLLDSYDDLVAQNTKSEIVDNNDFNLSNENIENALSRLSARHRQILVWYYGQQLEPKEIARLIDCSIQHVYNLRSQAIAILRRNYYIGGGSRR